MESANGVNPNGRFQTSNLPKGIVIPIEGLMVTADGEVKRISADQIPTGPGWTRYWVPPFEVEIPENMPKECWKDEILKKYDVVLDNVFENARIASDFEERLILEPKQEVQGPGDISMVRPPSGRRAPE